MDTEHSVSERQYPVETRIQVGDDTISYLKNSVLSSKTEKKSSKGAVKLEVPKMTKMS